MKLRENKIFKICPDGKVVLLSKFPQISVDKSLLKSILVDFLEMTFNNSIWKNNKDSIFYGKVTKTLTGNYQYTDGDGNIYYIK